jgi:hypothetical protein
MELMQVGKPTPPAGQLVRQQQAGQRAGGGGPLRGQLLFHVQQIGREDGEAVGKTAGVRFHSVGSGRRSPFHSVHKGLKIGRSLRYLSTFYSS